MKMLNKNILRISMVLAVVAGLIWLLYTYAQNILTFLNGSVNVLSEVVSSDTTHAFVRWVGMLLPAIIWVFVFTKYKPNSLTMIQRSVRNVVLWSCGVAMVCILWTAVGKDALEGVMLKSSVKSTSTTSNGWTVDGIQQVSWFIALIAGAAGFLQLWKKGQYTWRGWVCVGICVHILCAHFIVWLSRFVSEMLFSGWWGWLDMAITVGVYSWWTVMFFYDSAFNTEVVKTDRVGVMVLWERRLAWGNKIQAGPVALPCPQWLGLKVETESSKTETSTLETSNDKPVAIQAGSLRVFIKATVKYKVVDPILAKTTPLTETLRREIITQAITRVLQPYTDIKQIRANLKIIAVRAVLDDTKAAGLIFAQSGYELESLSITSAERDPKIEAAEIALVEKSLSEEAEEIDMKGLLKQVRMLLAEFPGMSPEKAMNIVQTQQSKIHRYQIGGSSSGGRSKKGDKTTAVILPP